MKARLMNPLYILIGLLLALALLSVPLQANEDWSAFPGVSGICVKGTIW